MQKQTLLGRANRVRDKPEFYPVGSRHFVRLFSTYPSDTSVGRRLVGGKLLYSRNPEIRVVITAITLETIGQIMALQKEMALPEPEIIQIQVSSAKKAGPYHLMQGQNPVYIVSF